MMNKIPKEFYSFETNAPFERCIACDKNLLEENTEYLIEKAVRSYKGFKAQDVVFDYAICIVCAEEMRKEISRESWQGMMDYFQQNMNLSLRMEMSSKSTNENLSHCMIKQTPIEACEEYQIYAHCRGDKLNLANPPYMISGEVLNEILHLLSDKTIDIMNGFFKDHFSPDPSYFEPTPKLILV